VVNNMKLSLCNEVLGEMPFPEQCALAAGLGYDGIELAPFTVVDDPRAMTAAQKAMVRDAAKDAGIAISGLHWLLLMPKGLSITTHDRAVWQRSVDVMRANIEICAELGGDVLVHGSPAQRRLPDDKAGAAAARDRAIEAFAAVARQADAGNVIYCIEALAAPMANFVNTVAEAVEIVEAVGSSHVRTMVDCAAARAGGDDAVEALIDRWLPAGMLAHVQVNDQDRGAPGQGNDRFAPIIAALKRHDYTGWIAAEPFRYEPDGPTCAAAAAGYLRGLIEAVPDGIAAC
jgi:sugar phosphate isomerase/epimerase